MINTGYNGISLADRWEDTGFWYTQRRSTADGTWHALPYPEGQPW